MSIPKTLYISEQTPHGPHPVDVYSHLLDDQIIFLTGEISEMRKDRRQIAKSRRKRWAGSSNILMRYSYITQDSK
jgi:ATP-dependent protease ClpP protease subunit